MTQKTPFSEILAQTSQKGEKWEKVNSEGKRKIDILDFIHVFPYIGYKMPKQKNLKKIEVPMDFLAWP